MSDAATAACMCGTCANCVSAAELLAAPVADPIRFRHSAILGRMLGQVGAVEIDGIRPLDALATTDPTDPAIALLDAFAGGLHVLAWNTRRIADDGTVTRGEDREALAALTALLGYTPRPALAATTTLSFALDRLSTSAPQVTIPRGTQIASVPASSREMPLAFETDDDLDARGEWNSVTAAMTIGHQTVDASVTTVTLQGATTAAKVGDLVLVFAQPQGGKAQWLKARVSTITRNPDPAAPTVMLVLAEGELLNAPSGFTDPAQFLDRVIVLGQRAAAFGATAPDPRMIPNTVPGYGDIIDATNHTWKNFVLTGTGSTSGGTFDLDAVYANAIAGHAIVAAFSGASAMGSIIQVSERSRADFGLSAKTSEIAVDGINLDPNDAGSFAKDPRSVALFLETARETLITLTVPAAVADPTQPRVPDPATSDRIVLSPITPPPPGRRVVLSGSVWNGTDTASEVATVKSTWTDATGTTLQFTGPLATAFDARTLTAQLNSISASQATTPPNQPEVLGSGSATAKAPAFRLAGKPLAHVPAPGPLGYAPALQVSVSARTYANVGTLYGHAPDERIYSVEIASDGTATVRFPGPLPTGAFNAVASYRVGGGARGNLDAARLSMMLTPVAGVSKVANPVPAQGGSDAEPLETIAGNAPRSIRTLDRVVALADYQAFAESYRGVGKALATELHSGLRRFVCLTIATINLDPPTAGGDVVTDLREALAAAAPPGRAIRIEGFDDLVPDITIALLPVDGYDRDAIQANVRTALGARFARAVRPFARGLHRSEVLAVVQDVEGVQAARIDGFSLPGGPAEQDGRLLCPAPTFVDGSFVPAGLLAIDPATVTFTELAP